MIRICVVVVATLSAPFAVAADKAPTAPAAAAAPAADKSPAAPATPAPGAAAPAASLQGKVLEVVDTDSFSYLRLQTKDGEIWAAVSRAPIKVGAEVTLENLTLMRDFQSKSLNRKFDRIAFGSLAGASATRSANDVASFHGNAPQAAGAADVKVGKASGANAYTVAEIVNGRTRLKDKPVVVRGKVVKVTSEVLGKNWIHLRDGSGSAADGTNDIVVTTKNEAKVGDVVVAKGVVHTDRDFGSGYSYAVLIEDATLQK